MPLDRHISVFAEPAFEPRNGLSLRGEATSRRPRTSRQASTLVYTKTSQPVTTKETAAEDEEDWIKFPRTTTLLVIGVVLTTVAATAGEHLPFFNYLGLVEFALVATLAAGISGCDVFGCVLVAGMTSVGGGTIRDVLLGNTPIFWMTEYSYVLVILGVSLGTFFLWPRLSAKFGLTIDGEFVFWADTIGLAAAVVAGAAIGEANHERVTVFASAIAGTSTGCFGGIFRDVFLQKPVRIMNSYLEVYASPCFLGALATALIIRLCPSQHNTALLVGFFIVIALRVLAVTRDIRHPTMVTMRDEVQTTTTPLSPKISPVTRDMSSEKLADSLDLPDDDGVRSPRSRTSTLSV